MKQLKTCKVIRLPTEDKTSNLLMCIKSYNFSEEDKGTKGVLELGVGLYADTELYTHQHLYLTAPEEIRNGDWCIDIEIDKVVQADWDNPHNYKKIVATTDHSLVFPLPAYIPTNFIKAYVKADGKIDEVQVEYIEDSEIHEELGGVIETWDYIKTRDDNTVIIRQNKTYIEEKVISLCEKAFIDGISTPRPSDGHEPFNVTILCKQWIEDNL